MSSTSAGNQLIDSLVKKLPVQSRFQDVSRQADNAAGKLQGSRLAKHAGSNSLTGASSISSLVAADATIKSLVPERVDIKHHSQQVAAGGAQQQSQQWRGGVTHAERPVTGASWQHVQQPAGAGSHQQTWHARAPPALDVPAPARVSAEVGPLSPVSVVTPHDPHMLRVASESLRKSQQQQQWQQQKQRQPDGYVEQYQGHGSPGKSYAARRRANRSPSPTQGASRTVALQHRGPTSYAQRQGAHPGCSMQAEAGYHQQADKSPRSPAAARHQARILARGSSASPTPQRPSLAGVATVVMAVARSTHSTAAPASPAAARWMAQRDSRPVARSPAAQRHAQKASQRAASRSPAAERHAQRSLSPAAPRSPAAQWHVLRSAVQAVSRSPAAARHAAKAAERQAARSPAAARHAAKAEQRTAQSPAAERHAAQAASPPSARSPAAARHAAKLAGDAPARSPAAERHAQRSVPPASPPSWAAQRRVSQQSQGPPAAKSFAAARRTSQQSPGAPAAKSFAAARRANRSAQSPLSSPLKPRPSLVARKQAAEGDLDDKDQGVGGKLSARDHDEYDRLSTARLSNLDQAAAHSSRLKDRDVKQSQDAHKGQQHAADGMLAKNAAVYPVQLGSGGLNAAAAGMHSVARDPAIAISSAGVPDPFASQSAQQPVLEANPSVRSAIAKHAAATAAAADTGPAGGLTADASFSLKRDGMQQPQLIKPRKSVPVVNTKRTKEVKAADFYAPASAAGGISTLPQAVLVGLASARGPLTFSPLQDRGPQGYAFPQHTVALNAQQPALGPYTASADAAAWAHSRNLRGSLHLDQDTAARSMMLRLHGSPQRPASSHSGNSHLAGAAAYHQQYMYGSRHTSLNHYHEGMQAPHAQHGSAIHYSTTSVHPGRPFSASSAHAYMADGMVAMQPQVGSDSGHLGEWQGTGSFGSTGDSYQVHGVPWGGATHSGRQQYEHGHVHQGCVEDVDGASSIPSDDTEPLDSSSARKVLNAWDMNQPASVGTAQPADIKLLHNPQNGKGLRLLRPHQLEKTTEDMQPPALTARKITPEVVSGSQQPAAGNGQPAGAHSAGTQHQGGVVSFGTSGARNKGSKPHTASKGQHKQHKSKMAADNVDNGDMLLKAVHSTGKSPPGLIASGNDQENIHQEHTGQASGPPRLLKPNCNEPKSSQAATLLRLAQQGPASPQDAVHFVHVQQGHAWLQPPPEPQQAVPSAPPLLASGVGTQDRTHSLLTALQARNAGRGALHGASPIDILPDMRAVQHVVPYPDEPAAEYHLGLHPPAPHVPASMPALPGSINPGLDALSSLSALQQLSGLAGSWPLPPPGQDDPTYWPMLAETTPAVLTETTRDGRPHAAWPVHTDPAGVYTQLARMTPQVVLDYVTEGLAGRLPAAPGAAEMGLHAGCGCAGPSISVASETRQQATITGAWPRYQHARPVQYQYPHSGPPEGQADESDDCGTADAQLNKQGGTAQHAEVHGMCRPAEAADDSAATSLTRGDASHGAHNLTFAANLGHTLRCKQQPDKGSTAGTMQPGRCSTKQVSSHSGTCAAEPTCNAGPQEPSDMQRGLGNAMNSVGMSGSSAAALLVQGVGQHRLPDISEDSVLALPAGRFTSSSSGVAEGHADSSDRVENLLPVICDQAQQAGSANATLSTEGATQLQGVHGTDIAVQQGQGLVQQVLQSAVPHCGDQGVVAATAACIETAGSSTAPQYTTEVAPTSAAVGAAEVVRAVASTSGPDMGVTTANNLLASMVALGTTPASCHINQGVHATHQLGCTTNDSRPSVTADSGSLSQANHSRTDVTATGTAGFAISEVQYSWPRTSSTAMQMLPSPALAMSSILCGEEVEARARETVEQWRVARVQAAAASRRAAAAALANAVAAACTQPSTTQVQHNNLPTSCGPQQEGTQSDMQAVGIDPAMGGVDVVTGTGSTVTGANPGWKAQSTDAPTAMVATSVAQLSSPPGNGVRRRRQWGEPPQEAYQDTSAKRVPTADQAEVVTAAGHGAAASGFADVQVQRDLMVALLSAMTGSLSNSVNMMGPGQHTVPAPAQASQVVAHMVAEHNHTESMQPGVKGVSNEPASMASAAVQPDKDGPEMGPFALGGLVPASAQRGTAQHSVPGEPAVTATNPHIDQHAGTPVFPGPAHSCEPVAAATANQSSAVAAGSATGSSSKAVSDDQQLAQELTQLILTALKEEQSGDNPVLSMAGLSSGRTMQYPNGNTAEPIAQHPNAVAAQAIVRADMHQGGAVAWAGASGLQQLQSAPANAERNGGRRQWFVQPVLSPANSLGATGFYLTEQLYSPGSSGGLPSGQYDLQVHMPVTDQEGDQMYGSLGRNPSQGAGHTITRLLQQGTYEYEARGSGQQQERVQGDTLMLPGILPNPNVPRGQGSQFLQVLDVQRQVEPVSDDNPAFRSAAHPPFRQGSVHMPAAAAMLAPMQRHSMQPMAPHPSSQGEVLTDEQLLYYQQQFQERQQLFRQRQQQPPGQQQQRDRQQEPQFLMVQGVQHTTHTVRAPSGLPEKAPGGGSTDDILGANQQAAVSVHSSDREESSAVRQQELEVDMHGLQQAIRAAEVAHQVAETAAQHSKRTREQLRVAETSSIVQTFAELDKLALEVDNDAYSTQSLLQELELRNDMSAARAYHALMMEARQLVQQVDDLLPDDEAATEPAVPSTSLSQMP